MKMTKKQILHALRALGFDSTADFLEEDATKEDESYVLQDLRRTRRDTTLEEMPKFVYERAMQLIQMWFENNTKQNPRKGKGMATYRKKKASNGRMMYFKDGKPCKKSAYDRAMKRNPKPAPRAGKVKKGIMEPGMVKIKLTEPQLRVVETYATGKRGDILTMIAKDHKKFGHVTMEVYHLQRALTALPRFDRSQQRALNGLEKKLRDTYHKATSKAFSLIEKNKMKNPKIAPVAGQAKLSLKQQNDLIKKIDEAQKTLAQCKKHLKKGGAKSNPLRSRKKGHTDAKRAMDLYHSGKAKSLKAAWRMVKRSK